MSQLYISWINFYLYHFQLFYDVRLQNWMFLVAEKKHCSVCQHFWFAIKSTKVSQYIKQCDRENTDEDWWLKERKLLYNGNILSHYLCQIVLEFKKIMLPAATEITLPIKSRLSLMKRRKKIWKVVCISQPISKLACLEKRRYKRLFVGLFGFCCI